jgi:predicted dithiol-disulfide oxidoreductase (DUF899 family)
MAVRSLAGESPEYRKLRAELLEAEIALRDQIERVAALRRGLPADTVVADPLFEEIRDGVRAPVRLSELFEQGLEQSAKTGEPRPAQRADARLRLARGERSSGPDQTLVLMHFMFGKKQQKPCPMCTLWADGYDGIVPHLRQRVSFAVLVAGDPGAFAEYARSRGWRHLRIVGAAGSDLKQQLGFELADGAQWPGASVFRRRADGTLIHTYSVNADFAAGELRGMDLLSPFWNFLDLTPEGRGDFLPKRSY